MYERQIIESPFILHSSLLIERPICPHEQINTQSADVLYQEAINLGQPTVNTSVLDICCGIGSIGLCFAKVRIM